ncbi:MAG: J domain-containing protein, partial [Chloroflexi bacterium]|nr:J domain-containing protein [Chloroflexota bacterium]
EDVAFGKDETIQIPRVETCQSCRGAGAPEGGWKECPTCRGSGQSVTEQRSGYTVFRQVTTCSKCRGKGMLVTKPCEECEGRGQVEKSKEFTVQVPKGADTGYKMKIDGEGESGPAGGQNGDLYIVLNVAQHPLFERHGDDIYVAKEIDLAQATLGGQLEGIPGLEGDLKAHIEEGTQNGAVVRIVNKGIPHPNSHGRGDEYVVLKVVTPTGLNKEEKELLRKFQGLRSRRSE